MYIFFRHISYQSFTKNDIQALFETAHVGEGIHGTVFRKIMIDFWSDLLVLDIAENLVSLVSDYVE